MSCRAAGEGKEGKSRAAALLEEVEMEQAVALVACGSPSASGSGDQALPWLVWGLGGELTLYPSSDSEPVSEEHCCRRWRLDDKKLVKSL